MSNRINNSPILAAVVAIAVAGIALLFSAGPASAAECKGASVPAYELSSKSAARATLCLINKERRARGVGSLAASADAREAAAAHSAVMVRERCFSHVCPGEGDLLQRLSRADYLPCNCSWGVAENIGYGFGRDSSPRSMVAAWMGSPLHRLNMLNRAYEHIGVGIRRGSPSGGSDAATYTTDFGYRN
jgi:uncharacterized protein YkwD